jgi:2-polyprenyl-3-methyl-5-hydroxy-6-metoxy-1,4-benzoquinol methylase
MMNRLLVPELMDDPLLDPAEHRRALAGLRRINFFSRSSQQIAKQICQVIEQKTLPSVSVLDIGCGSGDVGVGVAHQVAKCVPIELQGWDFSPTAVTSAQVTWDNRTATRNPPLNNCDVRVSFRQVDVFQAPDVQFDFVYCSLFLHHFSFPDATRIIGSMLKLARHMVLVDDLRRTRLGLLLAHVACRTLSRSPIVHFDGPQSVRAAFSDREVLDIANQAGASRFTLRRHWPQRYCLLLEKGQ